jgi:hypothetical protein
VVYGVAWVGLRMALARFPWPEGQWTDRLARSFSLSVGQRPDPFKDTKRGLGWPYDQLSARRIGIGIRRRDALLIPIAAGWCMHAVTAIVQDSQARHDLPGGIFYFVLAGCCAGRLMAYMIEYWPPISLWGRIATGRWIIPGYDRILAAPLCTLAVGLASAAGLYAAGVPGEIAYPISTALVLLVALNMGPSFECWRLTGHYRMAAPRLRSNQEYVRL